MRAGLKCMRLPAILIACALMVTTPAFAIDLEMSASAVPSETETSAGSENNSTDIAMDASTNSENATSNETKTEAVENKTVESTVKQNVQTQQKAEVSASTSNNIAMSATPIKNGWVTENGKVHYYNNSKIQTGWLVTSNYKNYGLQRYWMGAYGDLVSGGKIVKTDASGNLTYCSNAGYVARNKFKESNGRFYLADNGGKLEATTGWLVTGKYDGGGLQRYWLDASTHSVRLGEFLIDSAVYYGDWSQGYVWRNCFRVRNNEVWWADNGGVHTYYVKKCCNDNNVSIRIAYLWKDTMGGLWGDTARRAFDYVKNFRYINGSLWPSGDWAPWMAIEILNNGGGNCYRFAALYTMMIRAAGYSANAIAGSHNLGGVTYAHGWTEVYWGGQTYVCDPDGAHEFPNRNWYWVTYGNAPLKYRK